MATDERKNILKTIDASLLEALMVSTGIFFSVKYSSKNYRFLDIFKTKLTKRNKNFEPNLLTLSSFNYS